MAKKRSLPSPPPAPVDSSEEEQFSSSDSEEEEPQKTSIPKNANPNPRDEDEEETEAKEEEEDEESEEEEEATGKIHAPASDSESGSESDESPKAIKPIISKPMPPETVVAPSPGFFQRVWSLDAEIALLNGLLNYKDNTGTVPQNINGKSGKFADFPDLIRSSLGMDVSEGQLSDKIRRLKAKYARGSSHISSPHDRTMFELSEKIWGNGGAGEENAAAVAAENRSDVGGYRFLEEAVNGRKDFGAAFALEALERVEPGKARLLDEKFKKQKMAAMKLHLQRMELQKETFKAIMEGIDKSG